MTSTAYETMKLFVVACASGYFIGMFIGNIILGIYHLVHWIRHKRKKMQEQA